MSRTRSGMCIKNKWVVFDFVSTSKLVCIVIMPLFPSMLSISNLFEEEKKSFYELRGWKLEWFYLFFHICALAVQTRDPLATPDIVFAKLHNGY